MSKTYQELTFTDDFMFSRVLYTHPELCRGILELLLPIRIDRLEMPAPERVLRGVPDGKGVRFDVYTRDGAGVVYDIEMQVAHEEEIPRRSRYYHAMLDTDCLKKGSPYRQLKPAYVIFICKNRAGAEPVSLYEMRSATLPELRLGDDSYTCLVNAAYRGVCPDPGLQAFLHYVCTGCRAEGPDSLVGALDTAVIRAREEHTWEVDYMTYMEHLQESYEKGIAEGVQKGWDEGRMEGIAEGRAEGKAEGRTEGIAEGRAEGRAEGKAEGGLEMLLLLVRKGKISSQTAAELSGQPEAVFRCGERRQPQCPEED